MNTTLVLTMLRRSVAAVCGLVFVSPVSAVDGHSMPQAFLQQYCWDCHQGDTPSGGFALDRLGHPLDDLETDRLWIAVHDRLRAGEMPPQEATQPSAAERERAVERLSMKLTEATSQHANVVLRRLNRNEYENTVGDLFDCDVRVADVLPTDNSTDGFDNVGEGLAVSAEAAQAYLRAADVVLDAVFGSAKEPNRIRHETNLLDQKTHDGKPALSQVGKMFRRTPDGLVIFQSGYCPTNLVNFARLRAPAGTYRGTFQVRAIQTDEPVTLRIYAGDTIVGRREKHVVGYYDVPPGEWTTITFTDRLVEPGGTFQPKCYGTKDTRKDADTYPEPGIEIGDITIEGPLEKWPPESRSKLLGNVDPQRGTLDDVQAILEPYVARAYRRPVNAADMQPLMRLAGGALDAGRSFEDALRLALKGMLCSPQFLFLDEPAEAGQIDAHALAARLSYFLWSSMPDETLSALAQSGQLLDDDVLRKQTERMLDDPKAEAFTRNFVGQWLDLRDIDFTSPDAMLYPDFDELLRLSMVDETRRFFDEVLQQDLSLLNFVDSDFTFLNERLAEHYGIEGVRGQAFRKVTLPPQNVRGGVMTQASVLKVTANGTTTSPVLRGVWVLENILGQSVPPPPSNVPAVEPDIRGAVTLRQQLAKHRDIESCAACHAKIDPAGFALENFDVIGGWRDNYRTLGDGARPKFSRDPHTFAWVRWRIGPAVDATGQTYDGRMFRDINDFKKLLLTDKRAIARGLAGKLLVYSLGRRITFADREPIDAITDRVAEHGYGFRTLVHEIVQSDLFRKP